MYIRLHGGYTIENQSVYFEDFSFLTCAQGTGSLFIRDPSGGWWRYTRGEECSAKGTLFFNEEPKGEFELDLSRLRILFLETFE